MKKYRIMDESVKRPYWIDAMLEKDPEKRKAKFEACFEARRRDIESFEELTWDMATGKVPGLPRDFQLPTDSVHGDEV